MEQKNHIIVINTLMSKQDKRSKIENAIRLGSPILIENIGLNLEPSLENIIFK